MNHFTRSHNTHINFKILGNGPYNTGLAGDPQRFVFFTPDNNENVGKDTGQTETTHQVLRNK